METLKKILLAVCMFLLVVTVNFGFSWIITCGVYALICVCFGVEFNWFSATCVWLIYILLKKLVKSKEK